MLIGWVRKLRLREMTLKTQIWNWNFKSVYTVLIPPQWTWELAVHFFVSLMPITFEFDVVLWSCLYRVNLGLMFGRETA